MEGERSKREEEREVEEEGRRVRRCCRKLQDCSFPTPQTLSKNNQLQVARNVECGMMK